ncbi:MAG: hypothetical protein ACKO3P_06585, partial [Planctomycetaceae bacterium]
MPATAGVRLWQKIVATECSIKGRMRGIGADQRGVALLELVVLTCWRGGFSVADGGKTAGGWCWEFGKPWQRVKVWINGRRWGSVVPTGLRGGLDWAEWPD